MMRVHCLLALLALIVIPAIASCAQEIDWSHPETIDINRADLVSFLDSAEPGLKVKADRAYRSGKFDDAIRYYAASLRVVGTDGPILYNIACCYGCLGNADLAAQYLTRSVNAGFDGAGSVEIDPDFNKVRESSAIKAVLDGIAKAKAEWQKALGAVIEVRVPTYLPCRVRVPDGYDPAKCYPLLIGLHGFGGSSENFMSLWDEFGRNDFIYAAPEAPYPTRLGGRFGYNWKLVDPAKDDQADMARQCTEDYIVKLVQELRAKYKVTDVYLMGFSQGAGYTYMIGISNPRLFKGIMVFGGGLDAAWVTEAKLCVAKDLPIFIGHGRQDRIVDYKAATLARDVLKEHGYDVTFVDFEGGHTMPKDILQKAIQWMRKPREARP